MRIGLHIIVALSFLWMLMLGCTTSKGAKAMENHAEALQKRLPYLAPKLSSHVVDVVYDKNKDVMRYTLFINQAITTEDAYKMKKSKDRGYMLYYPMLMDRNIKEVLDNDTKIEICLLGNNTGDDDAELRVTLDLNLLDENSERKPNSEKDLLDIEVIKNENMSPISRVYGINTKLRYRTLAHLYAEIMDNKGFDLSDNEESLLFYYIEKKVIEPEDNWSAKQKLAAKQTLDSLYANISSLPGSHLSPKDNNTYTFTHYIKDRFISKMDSIFKDQARLDEILEPWKAYVLQEAPTLSDIEMVYANMDGKPLHSVMIKIEKEK